MKSNSKCSKPSDKFISTAVGDASLLFIRGDLVRTQTPWTLFASSVFICFFFFYLFENIWKQQKWLTNKTKKRSFTIRNYLFFLCFFPFEMFENHKWHNIYCQMDNEERGAMLNWPLCVIYYQLYKCSWFVCVCVLSLRWVNRPFELLILYHGLFAEFIINLI